MTLDGATAAKIKLGSADDLEFKAAVKVKGEKNVEGGFTITKRW